LGLTAKIHLQLRYDGQQGLESIRNEKFDLILLDLAMPEFTGMDIIKSIKQ
jgi:YesN/AraC family two-component response regulator